MTDKDKFTAASETELEIMVGWLKERLQKMKSEYMKRMERMVSQRGHVVLKDVGRIFDEEMNEVLHDINEEL